MVGSEAAGFLTGHNWSACDVGRLACIFSSWDVCLAVETVISPLSHLDASAGLQPQWLLSLFTVGLSVVMFKGPGKLEYSPAYLVLEEGEKVLCCEK